MPRVGFRMCVPFCRRIQTFFFGEDLDGEGFLSWDELDFVSASCLTSCFTFLEGSSPFSPVATTGDGVRARFLEMVGFLSSTLGLA